MNHNEAKTQILDLIKHSASHPEWSKVLLAHFTECYRFQNIRLSPAGADITIDQPSMTFTFTNIRLAFDLQTWALPETTPPEHGECLASGKGQIIYTGEKISEITNLEINLHRQCCATPEYNPCKTSCTNIALILSSLKSAYPYPNDATLANWAHVKTATIKRWQNPAEHANPAAVDQLLISFFLQDNIANKFL